MLPMLRVTRSPALFHPLVIGLLLLASVGLPLEAWPAPAERPSLTIPASPVEAAWPTGRPLADLLNADGTLNLNTGYAGSLDPRGWRMENSSGGRPRFVASAPGGHEWDSRFTLPGVTGAVYAVAIIG